jgi:hypothetical protein
MPRSPQRTEAAAAASGLARPGHADQDRGG